MITPLVALLLLAPTDEGQWVSTSLTPLSLAVKTDAQLASVRNAILSYRFSWLKDAVGSAYADCESTIVSPTRFRIQIPNVDTRRKNVIVYETWISDGKHFGRGVDEARPEPGPLTARPGVPAKPASVWFSDFSRVILSGLGQATHPFASLVNDAARQGYKTTTAVRRLKADGREYLSYRLVLAKGPARYETIIDGKRFLPVSVTNFYGKTDSSRWTGRLWTFPKKAVDASTVRFKTAAKAPSLSPKPQRR